jgi:myo-inositol-1(or 4)-monophosphatase
MIIIDCLKASGLPILSEECGPVGDMGSLRWIADPLDGTVNYYRGIDGLCCVSIALFDGNEPVLGVVNRFAAGELYTGMVGQGAELNGVPIGPSGVESSGEAVLTTGFPGGMDHSYGSLHDFTRCVQRVKKVRMLGSAALMAVFVACGRADIYFERGIRLWDIAGAMAIVKAAGGAVRLEMEGADFRCNFGAFATVPLMEEFYGF